jgi:DNA-binding response OmpR family regulator
VFFISDFCAFVLRENIFLTHVRTTIIEIRHRREGGLMPSILIADDNEQITSVLSEYAKKEGYAPITASDGKEALELFAKHRPDIVLLDVMMPQTDGFEVCREIRKSSTVPIIMVTARGEDFEKIMGLDIGADDYIIKPFSPGEVMARVRAVMRRITNADRQKKQVLAFKDLYIDLDDFIVRSGDQTVPLTKKEVEILWTLASNKGRVFTRDNLLNSLWGYDYYGDSRTVDSHIKRLRAKLDVTPHDGWEIKTIWGVGYKFEEGSDEK